MPLPQPRPFYLPTSRGNLFCVRYEPSDGPARSPAMVHLPAFGEEMNKSRRMVALQARALAGAGWTVVQPDLHGCGDSDGDHGDASWEQWIQDVRDTIAWTVAHTGSMPALWGLRAGCLLACAAARDAEAPTRFLMWQPALSGAQLLTQILRMKVAAQMLAEAGGPRVGTRELTDALARGEALEVAGYLLSQGLALGLRDCELAPPPARAHVAWLEIVGDESADLAPAAQGRVSEWRAAGHDVVTRTIPGPSFWQTPELTECPALLAASLEAVVAWPA